MRIRSIVVATVVAGLALRYLIKYGKSVDVRFRDEPESNEHNTIFPAANPIQQEKPSECPAEKAIPAPQSTPFPRPPQWAFWVGGIWLLTMLIPKLLQFLELPPTDVIHRFGTGLFLTSSASASYFLLHNFCTAKLAKKSWPSPDAVLWVRLISYLVLPMVALIGPVVFYHSWEGDSKIVGLPFGIGALISAFLFRYGPERLLKFDNPGLISEHKVELLELIRLERAVEKNETSLLLLPNMCENYRLGSAEKLKYQERIKYLREKWNIS